MCDRLVCRPPDPPTTQPMCGNTRRCRRHLNRAPRASDHIWPNATKHAEAARRRERCSCSHQWPRPRTAAVSACVPWCPDQVRVTAAVGQPPGVPCATGPHGSARLYAGNDRERDDAEDTSLDRVRRRSGSRRGRPTTCFRCPFHGRGGTSRRGGPCRGDRAGAVRRQPSGGGRYLAADGACPARDRIIPAGRGRCRRRAKPNARSLGGSGLPAFVVPSARFVTPWKERNGLSQQVVRWIPRQRR